MLLPAVAEEVAPLPRRAVKCAAVPVAAAMALLVLAGCGDATLVYAERACYRTLAEVDCHAAPLPGEESRRVGFYDAPIAVE
jgi:hypothetical protein